MYIDFKQTIWERFEIPAELEAEVVEKFKSKELETADALHGFLTDKLGEYNNNEFLHDSVAPLSPEENNGCSTVEIYVDPRKRFNDKISPPEIIWENGR